MSILATLGKENELALHIKGALNNGVTEDELKYLLSFLLFCFMLTGVVRELFLQIMVYAGAPAGMVAFRVADATIQAWKAEH